MIQVPHSREAFLLGVSPLSKTLVTLFLIALFIPFISAQTDEPVILKKGTRVFVVFTQKITSKKAKAGEYVQGVVVKEDISEGGEVIIEKNTPVTVLCTDAKKGRQMFGWRPARLALEAVSTKAVNGEEVTLSFEGEANKEGSAVATALVFAMEQKIKPGEIRVAVVQEDFVITKEVVEPEKENQESSLEKLEELKAMYEEGLITEEEFRVKRGAILKAM